MQQFLDRFGKAAQQKATEAKMRLDLRVLHSKLDDQAKALGHLAFRKHQGEIIADSDLDKLVSEMALTSEEHKAKEAELEELLHQPAETHEAESAPVATEPASPVTPETPAGEVVDPAEVVDALKRDEGK